MAAPSKVLAGPSLVLVGEGRDGRGLRARTAEVALLSPGSVVAPWPLTRPPTQEEAARAVMAQLRKSVYGAAGGVAITAKKARKILHDGKIRGRPLTEKQRRFFGAIASGQKPYRAQSGAMVARDPAYESAPFVSPLPSQAEFDAIRRNATEVVGTPLMQFLRSGRQYDVLAGATPELRGLFSSGLPTYSALRRMSPTQMGALQSLLAANEVRPEDFMAAVQRDFQGFSPGVSAGARARIMGYLR